MLIKALLSCVLFVFSLCIGVYPVSAEAQNNIFGIHISDINEAQKAAELVNSNGGEWGYVSIIINSNDRKTDKWQERMNQLNDKKLIPIVRLATYGNGDTWTKPVKDDAHDWAVFLSSLRWPTKQKIVVVYNEPNHGYEWGGATNPAEYAQVLDETITALRNADSQFVILNAGFDASAPQEPTRYMDQVVFMDAMNTAVPGIFSKLDGWTSHSYPNPGFSGRVTDSGRGSIRTFEWELELLRTRYGVSESLPIYITETGWITRDSDHPRIAQNETETAAYTKQAFEQVWLRDKRIRAVTPFLLTYKQPLFSHFSWLRPDDSPTETYTAIASLPKVKGTPEQEQRAVITSVSIPRLLQKGREVHGTVSVKNVGNTIWSDGQNLMLSYEDPDHIITYQSFADFKGNKVYPGQSVVFPFTMYYDKDIRTTKLQFQMKRNDDLFGERLIAPVQIFQPPRLIISVSNPPPEKIEGVSLSFINNTERDSLNSITIQENGNVGTFSSYTFVPGSAVTIELNAPNRDLVVSQLVLTEGENTFTFQLPEEYPFWKKFIQLVKGLSSSS